MNHTVGRYLIYFVANIMHGSRIPKIFGEVLAKERVQVVEQVIVRARQAVIQFQDIFAFLCYNFDALCYLVGLLTVGRYLR